MSISHNKQLILFDLDPTRQTAAPTRTFLLENGRPASRQSILVVALSTTSSPLTAGFFQALEVFQARPRAMGWEESYDAASDL